MKSPLSYILFPLWIFLALVSVSVISGCTVGSVGKIIINENYPGRAVSDTVDDVAQVVSTVVVRFGLEEYRESKKYYGQPCTMERSCMWVPEGKPWLTPWVYVFLGADGHVHVGIEMRNAWRNAQVKKITLEVGDELRKQFGSTRVWVDIGY